MKIPDVEIPEEGGCGGENLRPGCIFLYLLADDEVLTTRDRESSRKTFFRY